MNTKQFIGEYGEAGTRRVGHYTFAWETTGDSVAMTKGFAGWDEPAASDIADFLEELAFRAVQDDAIATRRNEIMAR